MHVASFFPFITLLGLGIIFLTVGTSMETISEDNPLDKTE